ncbi:RhtB (resistance to homoserine/threonine) family protein [Sporomusaceae bacterium BoRhaA]|uniref:LysE family translocator n=1 Tax=Pelorhabdus rhamnosifermentans TaxID=2772457 RepID=UPI001C06176C|nr:LysE family translocator [Pelorhabdus rhamnosifermentans]MBU2702707.1 RhtB (resistance to homoserine/threonine) family protein [Pelorhabdus rhamnosifermentans]
MFFEIFLIGILAGISPGPDFFIVMKNSLEYGKKIGIASAIGIGTAMLIHASYTIFGLALVLQKYIYLFKAIQILGACYLGYLGVQAIIGTFSSKKMDFEYSKNIHTTKTSLQGFKNGFLCNILNPKAFLFFLSIFAQFITPDTPSWVEWIYGLEVVVAVGGWFVILSIMISSNFFRQIYQSCRKWLDRFFGGLLLYFAYKITKSVFD